MDMIDSIQQRNMILIIKMKNDSKSYS